MVLMVFVSARGRFIQSMSQCFRFLPCVPRQVNANAFYSCNVLEVTDHKAHNKSEEQLWAKD